MEPENGPLEKEKHLQITNLGGYLFNSLGFPRTLLFWLDVAAGWLEVICVPTFGRSCRLRGGHEWHVDARLSQIIPKVSNLRVEVIIE